MAAKYHDHFYKSLTNYDFQLYTKQTSRTPEYAIFYLIKKGYPLFNSSHSIETRNEYRLMRYNQLNLRLNPDLVSDKGFQVEMLIRPVAFNRFSYGWITSVIV